MMLSFLAGFICGAAALIIVAKLFADNAAKPAEKPQHGIAAVGVSMDRKSGIQSLDPFHQRMMKDIIERIEGHA